MVPALAVARSGAQEPARFQPSSQRSAFTATDGLRDLASKRADRLRSADELGLSGLKRVAFLVEGGETLTRETLGLLCTKKDGETDADHAERVDAVLTDRRGLERAVFAVTVHQTEEGVLSHNGSVLLEVLPLDRKGVELHTGAANMPHGFLVEAKKDELIVPDNPLDTRFSSATVSQLSRTHTTGGDPEPFRTVERHLNELFVPGVRGDAERVYLFVPVSSGMHKQTLNLALGH